MEKLFRVTKKIVEGAELRAGEARSWRERYCADMRTRTLHGPEDYADIPPAYRLWIWHDDVAEAVGRLNLVPAPRLVGGRQGRPRWGSGPHLANLMKRRVSWH